MKHKLVRYKAKPDAVAENRRLIEAVFEALHARAPEDVSYMVIELDDGSFVHLKSDAAEGAFELGELPAFQALQARHRRALRRAAAARRGQAGRQLPDGNRRMRRR